MNSSNDLSDQVLEELHELVQSYGKCWGSDSCSPIGNNRPGKPAVCSASFTSGSGVCNCLHNSGINLCQNRDSQILYLFSVTDMRDGLRLKRFI